MKIAGDWIIAAAPVLRALMAGGHQALFVGGCVRNAALGAAISDVDIATSAAPDQVITLAKAAGFRSIPTGISHGTVTVLTGVAAYEVTTFRRDLSTDGRHAQVAFSGDIVDDAARRDFTMNAIYADLDGHVIDPLGGLPDLLARRLRFVGDPAARIAEDYLRILRFFRFHAVYAKDGFDADALAAIADNLDGLETISAERITAELSKLLAAPDPAPAVSTMVMTGVLPRLLPGVDPTFLAPLVSIEGGVPTHWLARLAVIGGGPDTLRLSRAQAQRLAALGDEIGGLKTPAALAFCHGASMARDAIFARAAVMQQDLPPLWQQDIARGAAAQFPIESADLPQTGPALGAALKSLRARWLASDLTLTKAELLS